MDEIKLGIVETRFAEIVWKNAPLSTKELVTLCVKELNWKRTTTYTVLKKLCERGIFKTENSLVQVLITKEDFYAIKSENIIKEDFGGSLPAFIAAFTKHQNLNDEEIKEIEMMINQYKGV